MLESCATYTELSPQTYDLLGYLLPYCIRDKLIIRQLRDKQHGREDSNLLSELLQAWSSWEAELKYLPHITFPYPYGSADASLEDATREMHI